jgi:hypothetical protein
MDAWPNTLAHSHHYGPRMPCGCGHIRAGYIRGESHSRPPNLGELARRLERSHCRAKGPETAEGFLFDPFMVGARWTQDRPCDRSSAKRLPCRGLGGRHTVTMAGFCGAAPRRKRNTNSHRECNGSLTDTTVTTSEGA